MKITFLDSFSQIAQSDWQQLNHDCCPFSQYAFYQLLETSLSVSAERGWQAHHLIIEENQKTKAILPLYLKQHSWGEYVFDWSWADAYQRHNLPYYPKLVATIPFTPVLSNKLLSDSKTLEDVSQILTEHCHTSDIHSWHLLFCHPLDTAQLTNVYQRNTVQFHWFNRNYQSFEHFLSTFTARKRKNTLKERQAIAKQGISVKRLTGKDISKKELDYFYLSYQLTYLKKGHQPHLSYAFFQGIFAQLANNLLLIIASVNDQYVGCALFFYDEKQLYGRYWGCTEFYNFLHFELCYYQGIEFCIEQGLSCFNPGTQGEHKLQRGFEPVLCHSYHWLKHPEFSAAVGHFCHEERIQLQRYFTQCQQALPFNQHALLADSEQAHNQAINKGY